ncbi:metal ABC transporter permease [Acidithiobacillus caldus]
MFAALTVDWSALFANSAVRTALLMGISAALINASLGVFTLLRGHAFAGHALGDISSAGGAASFLLGISALWGFLGMAWLAALAMGWLGLREARERDLATGIVLGAGLGLTALFLYLAMTTTSASGSTVTVLFGSLFAVSPDLVPPVLLLTLGTLSAITLGFRPLLLIAADADLARAQGIPVAILEILYLLLLGLAAAISAMTIGAILATALLLGPAGAALQLATRPVWAFVWAAGLATLAVVLGIFLSWQSYYWFSGASWPVSFFIVLLTLLEYLGASLWAAQRGRKIWAAAMPPPSGCAKDC